MKKTVISVILLGMFAWAVYGMAFQEGASPNQESFVGNNADGQENDTQSYEGEEREVGLNKGNKAPDFELETLDGKMVKLSDYQGQKVMLNFWATWCPPCRAEMPDMQRFYEDTDEDVEILAVNLTTTEKNNSLIGVFVEEFGLTFPILLDAEGDVGIQYKLQPIPTSYLIDQHGHIHHVAIGPMNYDMMVQQFKQMDN